MATLLLAGLSVLAVGLFAGSVGTGTSDFRASSACPSPSLAGTVVHVELTNMGGPMMGQGSGMMSGGAMGLNADQATVVHGTVSFFVTNNGSLTHELVILPLPGSQIAGTRQIGGDARIGETGSLGEASASCGEGPGEGILPGASSWVTVTLAPGRYELVCNLAGHYAAGMYTQITVT
ncbi:MAG: sulfocyanin-like copper-binding protein [Tepidiformaceae bacterium]